MMIISNATVPLHQRQALHRFFAVIRHVTVVLEVEGKLLEG
jgi:hypothetical protein